MKVKIGLADTTKIIELEIENLEEFKTALNEASSEGTLAWFNDVKGRDVGIPADKVAFVEVESSEAGPAVGFAPAV